MNEFHAQLKLEWTNDVTLLDNIIDVIRSVQIVYSTVSTFGELHLDPCYDIQNFKTSWETMVSSFKDKGLKFSTPNKVHIIISHIPEYLQKFHVPLSYTSDQNIESYHAIYEKMVKNSNYKMRDPHTIKAGEALLRSVKHMNGYNLDVSNVSQEQRNSC